MRLSQEIKLNSSDINYLATSAYNSSKWNLGKGWVFNNGGTAVDKYVTPQFNVIRPMEESTAFAVAYSFSINFSSTIDYVFGVENSTTASATRRIHLWSVNKLTGSVSWNGFITLTLATATAHTVRDFKVDRKIESTGTVSVSTTAVTGSGTLFATNKIAVGARIGFGSTNPNAITQWYRISARTSDTALTLTTSAGTIAAGTSYVIEEYRPVYVATNATTTNGGIHYAKGVSIEDFTSGGTTITLATTIDDVKAVYWLKDATTQTNIVVAGSAIDFDTATPTSLDCYVIDLVAAGNYKFYKYNLRAALTVATGASTSSFVLSTGNNPFTGTGSQNANLTIATASHGTGNGVKSLYTTTTTRLYRVPITQITSASTTVFSAPSDNITEIPTGGVSTHAATTGLSIVEYCSDIDKFFIGTTSAAGNFSYISQYVSSGQQFERVFGRDYKYLDQSSKDNGHPSIYSNQSLLLGFHDSGSGLIYITKQSVSAGFNMIYVMSTTADWSYSMSSSGMLISPKFSLGNVSKLYRGFVNFISFIGTDGLGKPTEPFKIYARTANIDVDTTTGWIQLDQLNDLSAFTGNDIQLMVSARTFGETCLPTRILGFNIEYEDNTSDSHFSFSGSKSSASAKQFAWRFKTAFGSIVPTLRVRLYDDVTGGLLLNDTTVSSASGVWQKSTDGNTWVAYNTTDKTNETTYIRYTPNSLADNITVGAYLTQA